MAVADQETVQPQQNAAQHDGDAGQEQARRVAPCLGTADHDERRGEAQGFQPEGGGLQSRLERFAEGAACQQVAQAHQQVDRQHTEHDARHRIEQMDFDLAPVGRCGNAGFEQHHAVADDDGGEQVEQGHGRCLPQRVDLATHHHQHGAQRGLVHHRQHHAQRDEEEQHLGQFLLDVVQAEFLQEDRRELDPHHHDVGRDAGCDFKHDRIGVHVAGPENVPEVPPSTEVEKDAATGQCVAEQAGQQGRPDQRVVIALVEDVDQQGDRKATAGQRRADHDVDHDPDAPGVAVVDVGDGADAEDEADQQDGREDGDEDAADQGCGIDQVAADGRRACVVMLGHAHFSPLPVAGESSSSCTFFLAMKLKAPSTAIGMIKPP